MITILLRIASVLAAIQGLVHGALFILAKPVHGDAEIALVEAMKANQFFSGGSRSYWDMYFGYGLIAAGVCVVEAILLWQLGRIAVTNAPLVRPIVILLAAANLVHLLLVGRYFMFVVPMAFDLFVAALLVWAWTMIGRAR